MALNFIFLRPWFLLLFFPVMMIAWYLWKKPQGQQDWYKICDKPLLAYFSNTAVNRLWLRTWGVIVFSLSMFVLALAGPSWQKKQVHTGQLEQAVVIVWDLSNNMLLDDISPTRLERSKLLIQDILKAHSQMQWGLIVFNSMPYVVTPITTDVENILNFLPIIEPKILPSQGYDIEKALKKAQLLIQQANYSSGRVLVISSKPPETSFDKILDKNIELAWVDVFHGDVPRERFPVWSIKEALNPLNVWLKQWGIHFSKAIQTSNKMLQYKDMGRLFLLLGMLPLVMIFRKGWFLRLWV